MVLSKNLFANLKRQDLAARRGKSDAYFGRPPNPHIWLEPMGKHVVPKEEMTRGEVNAYMEAYEGEEGRKDWGIDTE